MTSSNLNYYFILTCSYAVSMLVWWLISAQYKTIFIFENKELRRPWLQIGGIILVSVATILIGRLYVAGYLVPNLTIGSLDAGACLNQLIIYSPFPAFIVITKQSIASAWFPKRNWGLRAGVGFLLGVLSVFIFNLLGGEKDLGLVLRNVYHLKNTPHLIQVFMEDFAIALLLSRLSAALGAKYFVVALASVGILFSLGHVPANLEAGMKVYEIIFNRTIDAALVTGVGILLYRSKDFLWLWPIHFAMDMMQYYSGLNYE
jgi:hypothetical protein